MMIRASQTYLSGSCHRFYDPVIRVSWPDIQFGALRPLLMGFVQEADSDSLPIFQDSINHFVQSAPEEQSTLLTATANLVNSLIPDCLFLPMPDCL